MSLITDDPEDSPRHCATKHHRHRHHGTSISGRSRLLIAALSASTSLIALAIVLWLTLRPSSPRFTLLAASMSGPNATLGRLDAAFVAHNPNARAAALYDRLQARAFYGSAGVSQYQLVSPLPPFEQTQGDVVLSASMTSSAAPVSAQSSVETAAADKRSMTTTLLRVRVEGQLRWKVASWVSGGRSIAAECVVLVVPQQSPSQLSWAVVVQGSQCATTLQ
uniref:Uncharacterized protein n=1 Tax=Avena sativa TaxID=4498 RepID=A0ACD5Y7L8_AVESA